MKKEKKKPQELPDLNKNYLLVHKIGEKLCRRIICADSFEFQEDMVLFNRDYETISAVKGWVLGEEISKEEANLVEEQIVENEEGLDDMF